MRSGALLVGTFALSLALGAPQLAFAQPAGAAVAGKEQAKRLFEEGVDLEKKGDFAGALAKYRDAEQITVTAGLRFHKGYCLEMTGKLLAAIEEYEGAEKLAREQNKHDVRAAVTARLDPLRARIPQLAVHLAPHVKDVQVSVDGAPLAPEHVDGKPLRIDPGDHPIVARAPGFRPFSREVHVAERGTTNVEIGLEREIPPAGAAPAPAAAPAGSTTPKEDAVGAPPPEREGRSLTAPVLTTVGTVALVATGVVFFAAAGGARSSALEECPTRVACDDERTQVRTFDTLALGAFVGGAALGVVSVVLWTRSALRTSPAASTGLVATPTSLGLRGTWE